MSDSKIRIKQVETGEFFGLISGVAAEGYIPYVAASLENVFASSETGTFAVFNIPLTSGLSGYSIGFTAAFNGVPIILPSILCPSGANFINPYTTSADRSGCNITFSTGTTGSGYRLNVVAIDTFLVTSGLASILETSTVGSDLITAPTVALQRQILGVQALNEKNRANGYPGLNSNAQLDTGVFPSDYLNWDAGNVSGGVGRIIQFKRGERSSLTGYLAYSGEPLYATDTKECFIGDGVTLGGISLTSGINLANVVLTTGNQTIAGIKLFSSDVSVSGLLTAYNNSFVILSTEELLLSDTFGIPSVYWQTRTLLDASGFLSLDYQNRILSGDWVFNIDGGGF